jgi:hypothetical protein
MLKPNAEHRPQPLQDRGKANQDHENFEQICQSPEEVADRLILRGADGYEEARFARVFNARRAL